MRAVLLRGSRFDIARGCKPGESRFRRLNCDSASVSLQGTSMILGFLCYTRLACRFFSVCLVRCVNLNDSASSASSTKKANIQEQATTVRNILTLFLSQDYSLLGLRLRWVITLLVNKARVAQSIRIV